MVKVSRRKGSSICRVKGYSFFFSYFEEVIYKMYQGSFFLKALAPQSLCVLVKTKDICKEDTAASLEDIAINRTSCSSGCDSKQPQGGNVVLLEKIQTFDLLRIVITNTSRVFTNQEVKTDNKALHVYYQREMQWLNVISTANCQNFVSVSE